MLDAEQHTRLTTGCYGSGITALAALAQVTPSRHKSNESRTDDTVDKCRGCPASDRRIRGRSPPLCLGVEGDSGCIGEERIEGRESRNNREERQSERKKNRERERAAKETPPSKPDLALPPHWEGHYGNSATGSATELLTLSIMLAVSLYKKKCGRKNLKAKKLDAR